MKTTLTKEREIAVACLSFLSWFPSGQHAVEKNEAQKKGQQMLSPFFFCGLTDFKATAVLDEAVELSDIILMKRIVSATVLLLSCAFADVASRFPC